MSVSLSTEPRMIRITFIDLNPVVQKKIIVGILSHVFLENSSYLTSIVDYSVIVCDEIIDATNSVSIKLTNTKPKMSRALYQ